MDLSPTEWRTMCITRLRRARLLTPEDARYPGHPDALLLSVNTLANSSRASRQMHGRNVIGDSIIIIECLRRSSRIVSGRWSHFSAAVICGCNAGLFREALHDVYIPRFQRGNSSFTATVLGARWPLLSVLVHFFEHGTLGITR